MCVAVGKLSGITDGVPVHNYLIMLFCLCINYMILAWIAVCDCGRVEFLSLSQWNRLTPPQFQVQKIVELDDLHAEDASPVFGAR